MISKNIANVAEFDDEVYYKALCSCGCRECDCTINLSTVDGGYIGMTFYKDLYWYRYSYDLSLFELWERLKAGVKFLLTGRIKMEGDFLIEKDSVDDFILALQEGRQKLLEYKIND